jgi:DNA-binding winged helix-turn-helix (wHTH) protein
MQADPVTVGAPDEVLWRFGSFVLWEGQRRLEYGGEPVRLGSRSFDLLLHLLKHAGEDVSTEEFLAAVWTGVVVEPASVRVHMSILRKALGDPEPQDKCREWIATVPMRGYRFVGCVRRSQRLPGLDVSQLVDNCEHAIEPLSALLIRLLETLAGLHSLAAGAWEHQ